VVERMLGNVTNATIGMLPHSTRAFIGFELTSQQLNHGGLTSTIFTNYCMDGAFLNL
jgi:hypothetical protein